MKEPDTPPVKRDRRKEVAHSSRLRGVIHRPAECRVHSARRSLRTSTLRWQRRAHGRGARHNQPEKNLMRTRKASATWEGTLKAGNGSFSGESGAIGGQYSFGSRFENGI